MQSENRRETAIDYIHSLLRFGIKPGLERISVLLSRLGDPQTRFPAIHIAGTNGKGSVTSYCDEIFRAAGLKTGRYISPYVIEFRERMTVNGEMIPMETLEEVVSEVRRAAEGLEITEFEAVTAAAFLWFAREKCDVVCVEVGLGGRFDATNILPPPLASTIVSIGLDHTAVLGDTLSAIAFEKCGILKKGSAAVSYPLQEPEALAIIRSRAEEEGIPLTLPNLETLEIFEVSPFGTSFVYGANRYETLLGGEHQVYNAVTALETVRLAASRAGWSISPQAEAAGLSRTRFPARLEVLSQDPLLLLDGAHNPSGAAVLRKALLSCPNREACIVGMLADKDMKEVLEQIIPLFPRVYCVEVAENSRSASLEQITALCREYAPEVIPCESYRQAMDALLRTLSPGQTGLIFGSLYMAGAFRAIK
ncbi:MAG: bifunctional folylpolyglutamate synthase/dihydrofolate synthase [Ruminococcaceae bacterium]|nr:bifunctional folylpolyglutamate synthase/dihydrofolate synthase [Oscillospiraceae bacterium]